MHPVTHATHRHDASVAKDHPEYATGVVVTTLSQRPLYVPSETIDINARELAMAAQVDSERFHDAIAQAAADLPQQIAGLAYAYAFATNPDRFAGRRHRIPELVRDFVGAIEKAVV